MQDNLIPRTFGNQICNQTTNAYITDSIGANKMMGNANQMQQVVIKFDF